LINIASNFADR